MVCSLVVSAITPFLTFIANVYPLYGSNTLLGLILITFSFSFDIVQSCRVEPSGPVKQIVSIISPGDLTIADALSIGIFHPGPIIFKYTSSYPFANVIPVYVRVYSIVYT